MLWYIALPVFCTQLWIFWNVIMWKVSRLECTLTLCKCRLVRPVTSPQYNTVIALKPIGVNILVTVLNISWVMHVLPVQASYSLYFTVHSRWICLRFVNSQTHRNPSCPVEGAVISCCGMFGPRVWQCWEKKTWWLPTGGSNHLSKDSTKTVILKLSRLPAQKICLSKYRLLFCVVLQWGE